MSYHIISYLPSLLHIKPQIPSLLLADRKPVAPKPEAVRAPVLELKVLRPELLQVLLAVDVVFVDDVWVDGDGSESTC